jgi:hypothetical protein
VQKKNSSVNQSQAEQPEKRNRKEFTVDITKSSGTILNIGAKRRWPDRVSAMDGGE